MKMRTIIVTGAGSGIGRATCQALDKYDDVQLVLIGRRKSALEESLALLSTHKNHQSFALDLCQPIEVKNVFAQIAKTCQNVTALFANAGTGGENKYGTKDRWQQILDGNLNSTYYSIMESIPLLKASEAAFKHIVITSSCLARFGVPHYSAYCTAKTGLLGLTRSLAIEHAPDKILINAICPGWVDTEMAQQGIQKLADRSNISYAESFENQMSYVPLNRISQPAEIAEFVCFLMNNQQTSITGQALDINNGSYMG